MLPKILISTSAIGIYGDRDNEVLAEESKSGAGFLAELCHAWEHEAHSFLSATTRVVILRLGIVISQEGGALVEMLQAFRAGGNLASGKQWMSWIHIDDLVAAYIFALRNEQVTGVINATASKPVTNMEFTHTLSQLLHRPAIMPIPKVILR